jgi:hypothetical protein
VKRLCFFFPIAPSGRRSIFLFLTGMEKNAFRPIDKMGEGSNVAPLHP